MSTTKKETTKDKVEETTEDKNNKIVTLEIDGVDFNFNITRELYNSFAGKIAKASSPHQPMHNFLIDTIDNDQRTALVTIIRANPGSEMDIMTGVIEDYKPDLQVVVKKRKR